MFSGAILSIVDTSLVKSVELSRKTLILEHVVVNNGQLIVIFWLCDNWLNLTGLPGLPSLSIFDNILTWGVFAWRLCRFCAVLYKYKTFYFINSLKITCGAFCKNYGQVMQGCISILSLISILRFKSSRSFSSRSYGNLRNSSRCNYGVSPMDTVAKLMANF